MSETVVMNPFRIFEFRNSRFVVYESLAHCEACFGSSIPVRRACRRAGSHLSFRSSREVWSAARLAAGSSLPGKLLDGIAKGVDVLHQLQVVLIDAIEEIFFDANEIEEAAVAAHGAIDACDQRVDSSTDPIDLR